MRSEDQNQIDVQRAPMFSPCKCFLVCASSSCKNRKQKGSGLQNDVQHACAHEAVIKIYCIGCLLLLQRSMIVIQLLPGMRLLLLQHKRAEAEGEQFGLDVQRAPLFSPCKCFLTCASSSCKSRKQKGSGLQDDVQHAPMRLSSRSAA